MSIMLPTTSSNYGTSLSALYKKEKHISMSRLPNRLHSKKELLPNRVWKVRTGIVLSKKASNFSKKMNSGEIEEGAMVLRAKIDMANPNMHFRDPIIYRVVKTPAPPHRHHMESLSDVRLRPRTK